MEDVLFNGSEQFPPSGIARVSILFSRHRGSFPYPYSEFEELCIERALYRTGESEYRINQNPVRLKDVLDVFLDTGTSTRAYSIIPQGYVAEIISASPEQRRLFVEEAAGIVKYKTRKTSAIKKMDATRENLRHIEAILSEVKRQMNALKRQAQKARRFYDLKEEIRRIECQLASREYQALLCSERENESEKEEKEKKLASLLSELTREETEIEVIRTDLIQDSQISDEKRGRLSEQIQEWHRLENKQEYFRQSLEDLEKKIEEGRRLLAVSHEQLLRAEGERKELTERLAELTSKSTCIEEILEETRHDYERLVTKERELHDSLESVKGSLFVCLTRKADLHNKQLALREKRQDVEQRIEKGKKEIEQLRIENDALSRKQHETEFLWNRMKRERGFLLLQRTASENHEKELRGDLGELTERIDLFQGELHKKASRLHSLRELQQSYEGYHEGVRAIMQKRGEDEGLRRGILGMVADVLETEKEFEGALESVLGDRLQYIIVEEQQNGLQAIQYLKQGTLGRGSFIPLQLRGHLARTTRADDQLQGTPMMDLVTVKDGYENVANYLLGDVILVPDLPTGLELWRKNGHHERIVTKEGDIIDPYGVISGGRTNGSSDTRFLKTKREIRELQREVDDLECEYRDCKSLYEQVLRKIRLSEADKVQLQQSLYALDMEILKAEKDSQQTTESLRKNNQRLNILETENGFLARDLAQWATQDIQYVREQDEMTQRQSNEERRLAEITQEAQEWTRDKELRRERLSQMEIDVQLIREKRSSLVSLQEGVQARTMNLQAAVRERDTECLLDGQKKASMLDEMRMNEGLLESIGATKRELEEDLARLVGKMHFQTASAQEKEQKVRVFRKDTEALRQLKDHLLVKLAEIGLRKQSIKEQIWEKYRLDVLQQPYEEVSGSDQPDADIRTRLDGLYSTLQTIGEVNPAAIEEFEDLQRRHAFYQEQYEDLNVSLDSLQRLIQKINRITRNRFLEAFEGVNERFQQIFPKLFNGGRALLKLEEDKGPLEAGVEIVAQPPGKKLQNINLLSGGEKSLTALALVLGIFQYKPSPFCILDEVDAALDDVNVNRFNEILREIAKHAQFIVITHNKQTMEVADALYGVTMESPGVSSIVSVQIH